jgi:hypothetical protein
MRGDVDGVVPRSHRFAGGRGLGGWLCGLRCSVKFRSRRMPRTLLVLRRSASAQPVAPGGPTSHVFHIHTPFSSDESIISCWAETIG